MIKNGSMNTVFILLSFVLSSVAICGATEFYFVRHGQTDHNIGLIKKDLDLPLNKVGKQQAEMVKSYIKIHVPIKTICYSPLLRAKQTKDTINADLGLLEVEIPELAEGMGDFWAELYSKKNKPAKVSQSLQTFLNRVSKGLHKALLQTTPVLIVAHGGVYSALCRTLNISTKEWSIANCTLMHFYKHDGRWSVKHLFDVDSGQLYDLSYQQSLSLKLLLDV